ncbi:tryptophan-rich sensory protein [Micromonospora jinlongensis]|uniref:Tryptophan-rich sensory protein n=1 Tax=Micromonospora jinlongensis TaxID=1287877 RepID=A0A7Y9X408_9ACTN|nr:TspO/MBR family protein [Micromonospora jinlongensis]NYH43987.1 tryptophan-rich sensory protein [Micromonospora jinlongensis]
MRLPTLVKTAAAVTVTAAAGATVTDASSRWYQRLRKPTWQPPPVAFPLAWTPLYALIAVAGARVLDRTSEADRAAFTRAYALNLALNFGWSALFFKAHRPAVALAEIAALNASNFVLLRRASQTDRVAAVALAPYAAWTLFATALNGAIVRLNTNR